jgi:hypothetical protein
MFDLLTNILIWIIALPLLIFLFKNLPQELIKWLGLLLFTAIVVILFAQFRFVDSPVVREIAVVLGFPFTLIGLFVILIAWMLWRVTEIKIKSGDAKFVGEKYENKEIENKIKFSLKVIFFTFIIFCVLSNNFLSQVLICYFSQQAKYAIVQAYRRPVKEISPLQLRDLQNEVFDVIVVPLVENENSAKLRLIEVIKFIQIKRNQNQKLPIILLSGGELIYEQGYPCKIEVEKENVRPLNIVKQEIAGEKGLLFDPRLETLFKNRSTLEGELKPLDLTQADEMCAYLTSFVSGMGLNIKPSIVLEPNAKTVKRAVDEVVELFKKLQSQKIIDEAINYQDLRILLITPAIKTSREFLTFDRQELNVVPYPVQDECTECLIWEKINPDSSEMVWQPLIKYFRLNYLGMSFQALNNSEQVWSEVKELISYSLRFWIRPPLTDERPYNPRRTKNPTT